jgi:hypothetical protein
MQKSFLLAYATVVGLTILFGSEILAAQPGPPDFTQGGQRGDAHDWTLGPTGARGWV